MYQGEIEALLKELDDKDLALLAKALEILNVSSDRCHSMCEWSCTMGSLARSHLAYHLRRINLLSLAQRYVISSGTERQLSTIHFMIGIMFVRGGLVSNI